MTNVSTIISSFIVVYDDPKLHYNINQELKEVYTIIRWLYTITAWSRCVQVTDHESLVSDLVEDQGGIGCVRSTSCLLFTWYYIIIGDSVSFPPPLKGEVQHLEHPNADSKQVYTFILLP